AERRLQIEKIEVSRQVQRRYWDWFFLGKRYHILKSLLEIAIRRDSFLIKRVQAGDLPLIEQTDNQRAIAQRRVQVVQARRNFEKAALELSLYFRDQSGTPLIPGEDRLPSAAPPLPSLDLEPKKSVDLAILNRPELGDFEYQVREARADLRLAMNELLPSLDLGADFEKSLGGNLSSAFPENEIRVKMKLELPLLFRVGRGRRQTTQSRLDILTVRQKYLQNQIEVQVRDALIAVTAALENIENAKDEVRLASQVEEGERRRFEAGESSFILVNLREIATADAAIREIDALHNYFNSHVDYRAATAELL
ncbi:MAG: TolC family protein, partial [Bdellovibrionales bacterium]|nr:TolC family protein [Bdellovibrionales bacterium]